MRRTLLAALLLSGCAGVDDSPDVVTTSLGVMPGRQRCGTPDLSDAETEADDGLALRVAPDAPITIDVHVLEVTKVNPSDDPWFGKIPHAWLERQVEILNQAYVPAGFRFRLVSVEEVANDAWFYNPLRYDPDVAHQREAKRYLHRKHPGADVLRIVTLDAGFDLFGWGTFPQWYERDPEDDGVVLNFRVIPGQDLDPDFWADQHPNIMLYDDGDTAVHEVGHWLGLNHTFQGGCLFGDGVSDTPAQGRPNAGCYEEDTCPTLFGPAKPDPIHNFMNYTTDECMTEFTPGQIARMHRFFDKYRR